MMQLVEQHVIKSNSPMWKAIDAAAFASKNLYNVANYIVRQAFINEKCWIRLYGPMGLEKLLRRCLLRLPNRS
jgi:putative transposase